jgi:hypothetical protein
LNEKGIIFQIIFKLGIPVFVIAKNLKMSEAQVYRYLNGEKIPPEAEGKLKRLWQDLVEMNSVPKRLK